MKKDFQKSFLMFYEGNNNLLKEKEYAKLFTPFAEDIKKSKQTKYKEFLSNNNHALSVFQPIIIELRKRKTDPAYFNLFNVLNIYRREYIHSNILFWLLKPKGNHGFGVQFLNEVYQLADLPKITIVDKCEVSREDYTEECIVDISVSSASSLLFIENKIDSEEGYEQTKREFRSLKNKAGDRLFKGIYLTLLGEEPTEKEFIPWDYYKIITIIEQLLEKRKNSNDINLQRIDFFLNDYIRSIRQMI